MYWCREHSSFKALCGTQLSSESRGVWTGQDRIVDDSAVAVDRVHGSCPRVRSGQCRYTEFMPGQKPTGWKQSFGYVVPPTCLRSGHIQSTAADLPVETAPKQLTLDDGGSGPAPKQPSLWMTAVLLPRCSGRPCSRSSPRWRRQWTDCSTWRPTMRTRWRPVR